MPWFVEVCKSIFPAEFTSSTVFYDLWGRLTSSKYTIFFIRRGATLLHVYLPGRLACPEKKSSKGREKASQGRVEESQGSTGATGQAKRGKKIGHEAQPWLGCGNGSQVDLKT